MAECDYIADPQTELRDFYGEILFEDCDTCLRNRLRTCPYDIYKDTIITFPDEEVRMKTKQEIRERIERIEQTNREDGWSLGREIRERNQRIITVLKWVLGEVKDES